MLSCQNCDKRHYACWDTCEIKRKLDEEREKVNIARRKYVQVSRDHYEVMRGLDKRRVR